MPSLPYYPSSPAPVNPYPRVAARKSEVVHPKGHTIKSVIKSPLPLGPTPDNFDWCNVSGVNYCSKDLNQHIPQYCGSCWAHGSMSALADRWKIHSKSEKTDFLPAIQVILNCGTNVAGSCGGGSGSGAYQFVYEQGIPELTCQQYQAEDNSCSDLNTCRNCPPGGGPCVAVANYSKMYIDEFGGVEGEDDIKAEIFARGPVACGIDALPLESWDGKGIIDGSTQGGVNHIISLAGWGVTSNGTKFWIGRNSWGTYWGAKGWFYITTAYQPGCSWAVPRLEEKQPTITCSSDATSTTQCPADSQCCCEKRSIFKKTCAPPPALAAQACCFLFVTCDFFYSCESYVCCSKGTACSSSGCGSSTVVSYY